MPERSWDELVAEGRKLVRQEGDLKWQLGDLSVEVEPFGQASVRTGSHGRLQKYAEEIGMEFETLDQYRKVAAAWPGGTRVPPASWSAHRELMWEENRVELIQGVKSKNDARRALGKEPDRATPARRVAQARDLLADPQVAAEVMADPQVRHAVDEARPSEDRVEQARRLIRDPVVARHVVQDNRARSAMARAAKEMEDEAGDRQRERAPGLVNLSDFYQATGELSRARQALTKALDAMRRVDLTDDERESLKEDAGRARLVLEWIGSYLESGDRSFAKELDALLQEEA